jgi:hypothetical protein
LHFKLLFNIELLESTNYTDAAHEYGHMLGYFIDKINYPPGGDGQLHPGQDGPQTHAWRNQNEDKFIMGGYNGMGPFRRVHGEEYNRINWGRGLNLNSFINLPTFYPEKT